MQSIKTALVGFGISGQSFQTPVITACPEFDLAAVVSTNPRKVHQQLPNAKVYSNIESMLDDTSIELVIIATPNHLHVPHARLALLAGKHTVVEKPFCINTTEGLELIKLAEQSQLCLTVYQSRRYDGDFRTIQALIDSGKLNNIHTFYSSYNRYRPEVKSRWREQDEPGAGILYDLGAHLIDQVVYLFGTPISITAQLKCQRPNAQAVDHFHLILHYPEHDAILHGNCLSTSEGARFQVFAHNASYIKYGMDTQEDYLRNLQGPETPGWGEDKPENYGVLTDQSLNTSTIQTDKGGYEDFYLQLSCAIRHGKAVPVPALQALTVIRIIETAYSSSEQQRTILLENL